jgi:hypothetical protein
MGLNNVFLEDLVELKRKGAVRSGGRVIEIGAQQLANNFLRQNDLLSECYMLFERPRVELGETTETRTANNVEELAASNPDSRHFWRSIGFDYSTVDFDGHRDSTPLDLNRDRVPRRMRSTFDLVVNTGTTEHVANQDNAFRVMHDFCRPGGIMYHQVPAGGMMTHGLITYTPKFFWHLCRENDYEPLILRITSFPPNPVPQNIRDCNLAYQGHDSISVDQVPDFMIGAALRKRQDRAFVTPLDLPTE